MKASVSKSAHENESNKNEQSALDERNREKVARAFVILLAAVVIKLENTFEISEAVLHPESRAAFVRIRGLVNENQSRLIFIYPDFAKNDNTSVILRSGQQRWEMTAGKVRGRNIQLEDWLDQRINEWFK